jgi:hypothetical protein
MTLLVATVAMAGESIDGLWQGSLTVGAQNIRIVLHVAGDARKGYTATMDSPDQKEALGALAMGMKVDSFTAANSTVDFEMKTIQAKFTGKLNRTQNSIAGSWSQVGTSLPLTLNKTSPPKATSDGNGAAK